MATQQQQRPVLPNSAAIYETALVCSERSAGQRFISEPSIVAGMATALTTPYYPSQNARLWTSFIKRASAEYLRLSDAHSFIDPVTKVLFLHEDVARDFASWLEAHWTKKRENKKQRALRAIDTNVPHASAAKRSIPQVDEEYEKEVAAHSEALATLRRDVSKIRMRARSLMKGTTEFTLVDETAAEVNCILGRHTPIVVALAREETEACIASFCPGALAKIDWQRLLFPSSSKPRFNITADVDLLFQPLPNPVPSLV